MRRELISVYNGILIFFNAVRMYLPLILLVERERKGEDKMFPVDRGPVVEHGIPGHPLPVGSIYRHKGKSPVVYLEILYNIFIYLFIFNIS